MTYQRPTAPIAMSPDVLTAFRRLAQSLDSGAADSAHRPSAAPAPTPGDTMSDSPPPVIVRPPGELGPVELLIHYAEGQLRVDVRSAGTSHAWTPLKMVGGSFETRPS